MSTNDNTRLLEEAGTPIHQLSPEQRQVLAELSREEVETLIRIQQRIAAGVEVQGYRAPDDPVGLLVF